MKEVKLLLPLFFSIIFTIFSANKSYAQDTIPAPGMKAASHTEEKEASTPTTTSDYETIIREEKYKEGDLVGKYKQPVWTLKRRFPTTRVYVLPYREVELEYWLITKGIIKEDEEPGFRHQFEVGFGLGKRFQLDLYLRFKQGGYDESLKNEGISMELRYAFADWGKIPGNPTLYLEWIHQNEKPQKLEVKGLFGGGLSERWFYGINLIYEVVMGEDWEMEYGLSAGLSSVISHGRLLLGIEGKVSGVDSEGDRFHFSKEVKAIAGPSLQIKTGGRFHIDIVPMFGALYEDGETNPYYEIYTIAGASL